MGAILMFHQNPSVHTQIKPNTKLKKFGRMSSKNISIQKVLAPTTRPPPKDPKSNPPATGTKSFIERPTNEVPVLAMANIGEHIIH
ncbi:unnamed protein product [Sphenostylis stenocarpa]|uniref:Uncharacterized protein n=1 Tax=Sphenostylis stenocarpa TaxID=92480 RepID=A0AA86SNF9_9FABA|nr:unnamed protein product [Sphenostylis stenocarpa]